MDTLSTSDTPAQAMTRRRESDSATVGVSGSRHGDSPSLTDAFNEYASIFRPHNGPDIASTSPSLDSDATLVIPRITPKDTSTAYLIASFDLFNVADIDVVGQVRERCDRLVVGVLPDDAVARAIGQTPVIPMDERLKIMGHVRGVDEVIEHDPTWVNAHAEARVYAFGPVDDIQVDESVVPEVRTASPMLLNALAPAVTGGGTEFTDDLPIAHTPRRAASGRRRPGDPHDGQMIGYAPGAWDMFHIGHLNILLRARENCDRLIVGVVTDGALLRAKNKLPVVPLAERMQVLRSLGLVDEVVVDRGSKLEVWQRHPYDILFKGDDWRGTPKGDQLEADMASVGVRVHFFPYTAATSSTRLRRLLEHR